MQEDRCNEREDINVYTLLVRLVLLSALLNLGLSTRDFERLNSNIVRRAVAANFDVSKRGQAVLIRQNQPI